MSTNASSWFYNTPEGNAYLITERLNGTFWAARMINFYWKATHVEAPFQAEGFDKEGNRLVLEWEPSEWLSLKTPVDFDATTYMNIISDRIMARPASIAYTRSDGSQVYEWHVDGGKKRWQEIQGKARYSNPRKLN